MACGAGRGDGHDEPPSWLRALGVRMARGGRLGGAMVNRPLVLLVDPGHGGRQSYGAMWPTCSVGKLWGEALELALAEHAAHAMAVEKDINLNVALALRHAMEGCGWPVVAELTRDTDESMGLDARAALGTKHGASMAVSIHCDTNADSKVAGMCSYVREGDAPASSFARDLMVALPRELRRGFVDPMVCKPLPHWTGRAHNVLAHHVGPAVLVECGFLSNDANRSLLVSSEGQGLVVAALMSAVACLVWRSRAAD